MKNRDEYNKKFDKTSKKMLDVIKRSKDRKSNMVTASDRPYLKKVLDNITKNPRSLRKEPFSDMTNSMDYVTIQSTGNSVDFGDLTQSRQMDASCESPTRGIFRGGNKH